MTCNTKLTLKERKALCFALSYIENSIKRGAAGLIAGAENVGVKTETLKALARKFCGSLEESEDDR